MSTTRLCLISSPSSTLTLAAISSLPPKSPNSKQPFFPKDQHQCLQLRIKISRRDVALISFLAVVPSLFLSPPGAAFEFGISGPKDWLREQKKKASKFLLAPIDASRGSLRTAYRLLASENDYSSKNLEEVQELLRSAARDCVPEDRNSFVQFQANTGVEVCTFRLIVKNASSLLGNTDPVKLEAEAMLNDLIRSFTSLNGMANETDIQVNSNRKKVAGALMDTISSLDKFELGIKDCLGT